MASQIPYDHQIWELTPSELEIAYLSLTKSKKEIAAYLVKTEGNIGTHLTNIFSKLGMAGVPDDEKRPLLKQQFSETIETLVAEIGGDYEVGYKDLRREALEKRREAERQKPVGRVAGNQTGMNETPPEPVIRFPFTRVELNRRDIIMIAIGFTAGVFLLGLLFGGGEPRAANVGDPTAVFTHPVSPEQQALTQPFPSRTPTSNVSPTPENTSTPENTPTPYPWIREDFSRQISDLWTVIGDPIITESIQADYEQYSGVLTNRKGDTSTLLIGNTAWTDYVISTKISLFTRGAGDQSFRIGVRVQDLNNMVVFDCDDAHYCTWIVIYQGEIDELITPRTQFVTVHGLTITVDDDTFTALAQPWSSQELKSIPVILPQSYRGKFDGGGVMLETHSNLMVDHFEIQEFR